MAELETPKSFWGFYWSLFVWSITAAYSATDRVVTVIAVLTFIATLINKELAHRMVTGWEGLSRWWSIVPIVALMVYRLLRANYTHFEGVVSKLDGVTLALSTTNTELEKVQKVPAQIEITPYELRSSDSTSTEGRDIFLRVKVELLAPIEALVQRYSVELSFNGLIETPEVRSVANKWRLHDGTPSMPRSQPMAQLPASLRSGHPVEGWMHFLTTRSQYELESSRMTLFVHTSRGDGNVQFTPVRGYWLSSGQNFIMPDLGSE